MTGDDFRDLLGTERDPFGCYQINLPEFNPISDGVNTP
jgi:hypothetical protein